MDQVQRLKELSGLHPQYKLIEELKSDRKKVMEFYDKLIADAEQNRQLDEGLFTALKAAVATAGALGAAGAKKVGDVAKKVADNVKEIYLDQKAKVELENLLKNLNKAIADFEVMEKDASTIIKKDVEVAKAMAIFKDAFTAVIKMVNDRMVAMKEPAK